MKESIKNKEMVCKVCGWLTKLFAFLMATVLLICGLRSVVYHNKYGYYVIDPFEKTDDFQKTGTFYSVFEAEVNDLTEHMAMCSQLLTNGEFDPDKEIDVFQFVTRKDTETVKAISYPKLIYSIGDLIELGECGLIMEDKEMSFAEAEKYVSKGEIAQYYNRETGTISVSVSKEVVKPKNVKSIYDLELPDGVFWSDVIEGIERASSDLAYNYACYMRNEEFYSKNSNVKYMFVSADGNILYTNLKNKNNVSLKQLKEAFFSESTYIEYDYSQKQMRSRNLLLSRESNYKQYFRNFAYCFPEGGVAYVAVQTGSSDAFGPYNTKGFYAKINTCLSDSAFDITQMLAGAVIFTILMMITLCVFIICQPKKKEDELTGFDAWYTELALAFVVVTTMLAGGIGIAIMKVAGKLSGDDISKVLVYSIYGTFLVLYLLFVIYMGSLVRRIKSKVLWKRSLCYKLILKGHKLFRKWFTGVINHKSFVIRTLFPYACFVIVNVFGVLIFEEVGVFLVCVLAIGGATYLYYQNTAKQAILEGITRICDGDVGFQIDSSRFIGENKVMAEAVNKIGEAVNTAVQISMKDERLKADLITNVSHDIKTPLTSIINYVDLLKREEIQGERAKEYVRILDEKSQRLKQLTLDLVEASKISSGNITLEMSEIDIRELLCQALGEYEDRMAEKELALVENYAEAGEFKIWADSRHMWRVIENLLVNICKYSLNGTRVYIDVNKVREDDNSDRIELIMKNISDRPLNISPEELTERFIRGDESRSTEGSGLGLSIAKNLTLAQGGEFNLCLDGDLFKVVLDFPAK